MTTPKKFSQLEELTVPDIANFPNNVYVPAFTSLSGLSTNKKMSMSILVLRIVQALSESGGNESGGSSGGGSSGGGSSSTSEVTTQDIQNLLSQINSINSTIGTIANASNYPTHVIVVRDGENNEVSYNLPTGPNSLSQRITIRTSELDSPKFKLNVSTVGISKNDNTLMVSVYAEANATASNCTGGSVDTVKVSGSFTTNSTSGTFAEETVLSARTVTAGNNTYNSILLSAQLTEAAALAVILLTIKYGSKSLGITVTASIVGNSVSNGSASTYIFD